MKIRSWVWSCGPTVFRERSWGTVLRMKHSRQKWIGYLLFDAAFRPSFVARLRLSPRLGRIFFKKQTSNQLNDQLVIAICDLKISLFERRVSAAAEPEKQEERTITGITRYLQEHLAEELSLSVLAEQFHLNPQYISQLFKSEIGVNFLAYLTSIRMEKAKKLLLSTSLSVAEVAEQSGYGDYRVFTKVFKKSEGITPSQYRRDFQSDVHLKI